MVGNVTDANGLPLPSVTVQEEGTSNGVLTDFDGNFSIEVGSDEPVLVFTYIGMQTLRKTVEGNTTMNIQMQEDKQALDEIVVVGYGTQKKVSMTSAVSTISGDDVAERPTRNLSSSLQGLAPGLTVVDKGGAPGSANIAVNIRGSQLWEVITL